MNNKILCSVALAALSAGTACAQDKIDSSPHTAQFVTVEPGIKLECSIGVEPGVRSYS